MPKFSFYNGIIVAAPILTIMIIVAELFAPFKNGLKAAFGHHWIGKVVISIILFVLAGFLLSKKESWFGKPAEKEAWKSAVGSIVIIGLFFVVHYFWDG